MDMKLSVSYLEYEINSFGTRVLGGNIWAKKERERRVKMKKILI
jgi:hypothetical protein